MPRTGIYGVNVKYSTVLSTLPANEKAALFKDLQELFNLSNCLDGEKCVTQVYSLADCPNDSTARELAVMATLRFYSNVRYLVERIKDMVYERDCASAGD